MRSMTGYGHTRWQKAGRTLTVEIRGVNQRFLEVKLNMPREFLPWESELRALIQERVARGKVDVAISQSGSASEGFAVEVNVPLAREMMAGWRQLQKALELPDPADYDFLRTRDILRPVERRAEATADLETVRETLAQALDRFNREREREGQALAKDMQERVKRLATLHKKLGRRAAVLKPELAARLRERVASLLEGRPLNEERLLQEVALIAERADVTEELVRLESHLKALRDLLRGREPAGKKLDFLLQETHREVNTIASKSADLEVTNMSVDARAEIEKLREQVQNVE
jgi:uncharacterized protein (TIGR00255 family)